MLDVPVAIFSRMRGAPEPAYSSVTSLPCIRVHYVDIVFIACTSALRTEFARGAKTSCAITSIVADFEGYNIPEFDLVFEFDFR